MCNETKFKTVSHFLKRMLDGTIRIRHLIQIAVRYVTDVFLFINICNFFFSFVKAI